MKIVMLWIVLLCSVEAQTVVSEDPVWGAYQKILVLGVKENTYIGSHGEFIHSAFDYKSINKSEGAQKLFRGQISLLKKTKAPSNRFEKLSFWMNAYNFFTLVEVNRELPVKSMKDIGWKNKRHNVNGSLYSLDQIEHKILRPMGDPRIHFAINCASVSCPSLSPKIFTPKAIGLQMNILVENSLKNPLHLTLKRGRLYTTKLLDWFAKDFNAAPFGSPQKFINKYAPSTLKKSLKGWISYDWKLNSVENIDKAMKKLGVKEKG